MSWGADGIAQAWAVFTDVDEAADRVCASVWRAAVYGAPEDGRQAYRDGAETLAARMREAGREAVSAGRSWEGVSGPVRVSLVPVGGRQQKAPHRPGNGR